MIEITKKITYVFILMFSFIFSQCDEYSNESECSSNSSSCYWESDLTNYNCTQFNSSSACSQYADYGCSWEFSWGGWMNHGSSCVGGGFQVDNGTCQEVEMPECSGMEEVECDTYSDCNWIEDYEWSNCSSYDSAAECSWANDNGGNCDWSWNSTEWQDTCSGGSFQLDNSYCEESEDTFDQCSDLETMPYCNHSSLYDLDCMWVDGQCIDYEEPQLECSEMNQTECSSDNVCEWVENIEIENCYDILDCTGGCTWQDCEAIEGCNWHFGTAYYDPSYCYGEHEVDNSYCEEIVYLLGDYNSDGIINVIDVTQVINLILNADSYDIRVDMNSDGIINISDIIVIVNIILNT